MCLTYDDTTTLPTTKCKDWFQGIRPFLEGFVVTLHEGACETGSRLNVLFAQARVHCDNKPRQIGLNSDYNMTILISTREC